MSGQYEGKNVVVTGASSGIGVGIAKELARRGAHVILVARREDQLTQIAQAIITEGGLATPIACDVVCEASLSTFSDAIKQIGKVHLLVNNAGKEMVSPLQITKPQDSRDLLELNVVAMANLSRICLRFFGEGAAIINMASVAGMRGVAGMSLYSASKGAVIALTQSMARELAPRKIRVNAIAPGIVLTEMTERMFKKQVPAYRTALEAAHPLGFGAPQDIAFAVAFLGGDEARWITGHTLVVDGGYSA